ncbi:unnamed protein product [Schistosoma curassoni]|uniref:DUF6451 domain-containing protein n=1 Tax=Schistosoma curassoni TaxID=6186 RepID=A0A183JLM7_9TREM|nr:unnamed protein product [Schistosoma curassoni]
MKNTNPITLDGEALQTSNYLLSIIDEHGRSDADVKERIRKARAAFLQLKNIWKSKQLSTNCKVIIFNTNVKTVLLYGAETENYYNHHQKCTSINKPFTTQDT